MTPTPKSEALKAIETVRKNLQNGDPLDHLSRKIMAATLDYAAEQIGLIQEVKRRRKGIPDA